MTLDRRAMEAALPAYEVGPEIGRGAFGVVYKGHHRQLQRTVAIKQLPRALAADPAVQQRFLVEARTAAALQHPNIVPVYDFVERDGLCLLIMEFIEGGTLTERASTAKVPAAEACRVVAGVLDALQYAHDAGVVHRDVKPDNIMVSSDGTPKLSDFGIAKVMNSSATATAAGAVMGTPAYMAPEVATGEEATPAADVYSCAAVLYELLSGSLPHRPATTATATLVRIVNEPPKPLAEAAPQVESALAALVMTALSKEPAQRPTAAAFAAGLRQVGAGSAAASFETVAPRGVPRVEAAPARRSSRRGLLVAAVVALVAVGGAVAWGVAGSDETSGGSPSASTVVASSTIAPADSTPEPSSSTSDAAPGTTVVATSDAPATTVPAPLMSSFPDATTYVEATDLFKVGCQNVERSDAQCECMILDITDQLGQQRFVTVVNQLKNGRNLKSDVTDIITNCLATVN
ncbi:MAG: protein kinase [Ilumatobacteraceae bacterium]